MTNRPLADKKDTGTALSTETFFSQSLFQTLFWRPRLLTDNPAVAHLPFLFWLMAAHRPRHTTMIGCGDGAVFFALCQAADKSGFDSAVEGIGFWGEGEDTGIPDALSRHQRMLYEDIARLTSAASLKQALEISGEGRSDLLVIDLAALPQDAELSSDGIFDCLAPDGILVLHGTNGGDGVGDHAFRRLIRDHRHISLTADLGLTVLFRNDHPAAPLGSLLDYTEAGALPRHIESVFRQTGQGLRRASEAMILEDKLAELTEKLSAAEKRIAAGSEKFRSLTESSDLRGRKLAEVQGELFHLQKAHAELEASSHDTEAELTGKLAEAEAELARSQAKSKEDEGAANKLIEQLRHDLETARKDAAEHGQAREQDEQKLADLTKANEQLTQDLAQLGRDRDLRAQEATRLTKLTDQTQRRVRQLTEVNEQLTQEVAQLNADRDLRFKETAALTRMNEQTQLRVTQLTKERDLRVREAAGLLQMNEHLKRQIEHLTYERDILRGDKARLEEWMANMRKSTSWRVTAPLRSVKKLVKPGR